MRNRSRQIVVVLLFVVLSPLQVVWAEAPPAWAGPRAGYPEDVAYDPPDAPGAALPGYLFIWEDPTTLTAVRRITRYEPDWDWYPHHEYSKAQPWNIDQSLYRFYTVAVFDAVTHRVLRELPGDLYPTYWSNTDPDLLYSFRADGTIQTYRVSTGERQVLGSIGGYELVKLGPGEGNIDIHDHLVAFVGKSGEDLDVVVWDLQAQAEVARRRFPGAWGGGGEMPEHVDWVSVSQSGRYVVMSWVSGPPWDVEPFDGHYGVEAYDPSDLSMVRRLVRYGNHGDLGFTPSGDEVYVQFWGDDGTINAYGLDDGSVTVIQTHPDFGVGDAHLSCRNILRPGWAYVSTDPSRHGLVVAVKLDGSGTVELFGHHMSSAASYLKSPMPVPSPDGRRVMFKSDFGDAADAEVVYEFEAMASDSNLLYRNGREITVTVETGSGGVPTFTATRSDGTVLREPFGGERFVGDRSGGALDCTWTIDERSGGVDVAWTIFNPSGSEQPLPELRIEGLRYAAHEVTDSLEILSTATHQYLHRRSLGEDGFLDGNGQFQGYGTFEVNGLVAMPYPRIYAPVIVAGDGEFTAGSALLVHGTEDGLRPEMFVELLPDGHWCHVYDLGRRGATIPAGATVTVTASLRFAAPRNWLVTLFPYRAWFDGLYGGQAAVVPRDTRPVSGVSLSYDTVAWEQYQACLADGACPSDGSDPDTDTVVAWNLRGSNWYLRTDRYGLDGPNPDHGGRGFVSTWIQRLQEAGFERAMMWTFSGQFWRCPDDQVIPGAHPSCGTNFPHQFMSDLLPAMQGSLDALGAFADAGIELGFWWGRAGQVPQPMAWNPDAVVPLDPANPDHVAFADNELSLAVARGAVMLGLDAFPNMARADQLGWLAHLAERAPGIELWSEGSVTDWLHTRSAIFLQPENPWSAGPWAGTPIEEPALLPAYLNPGAEIAVYLGAGDDPAFAERVGRLMRNGYTPVIAAHPNVFDVPLTPVGGLDRTPVPCADGKDNDGDGLADFPFDPGCASAADGSELPGPGSVLDEVAEIFDLDGTAAADAAGGSHRGGPDYDMDGDGTIAAADVAALLAR